MQEFDIYGMSCAACQARIEKAVSKLDGVKSCSVNLLTNSMSVESTISDDLIIKAVIDAGYDAKSKNEKIKHERKSNSNNEIKKMLSRLIPSLIILLILMYFSMGTMMFSFPTFSFLKNNHIGEGLLELLLSVLIMIINQKYFISGFKSLFKKAPNMDTLIALGSSVSFLYSVYILFNLTTNNNHEKMPHFYFETAAMILVFISIGKTLEAYSKGKTTSALNALIDLAPKKALILKNEIEVEVNVEEIKVNDLFIVKKGQAIPVDGLIIKGQATIDESTLTGEGIPLDKSINDEVFSGTINKYGYIVCKAIRVNEETTLAKIIKRVSEASASKAPIAKIADKVSGIFVPVILSISIIVFLVWMIISSNLEKSLIHAISVLVISCPCALGLATPVAIMVGNGVGAKRGILFKNATSLEHTSRINLVCLDKTGTITKGLPSVKDIINFNNFTKEDVIKYAYSLENNSEHPLAKAIINYAKEKNINLEEIQEFEFIEGSGLKGKLNNKLIFGGNYKFISKYVHIEDNIVSQIDELSSQGKTPLLFVLDNVLMGIISIADEIKESSIEAINELKEMGIKVIMLTGDNKKCASYIASNAKIDEVYAELLPLDKERIIKELQAKYKVAMVGDGVNDAPSLVSADIGIAIGAGSDIAIDSADIVLVNNNLKDVAAAIRLSKYTLTNIYENLFWAFIYNIIGIPLAAGIFKIELNPMYGSIAMSLSSIFVVTNALRLNLKNIYKHKKTNYKEENKIMTKLVKIKGMMCAHCETHIKNALLKVENVIEVTPDFKKEEAIIVYNNSLDENKVKEAIVNEGYEFIEIKDI